MIKHALKQTLEVLRMLAFWVVMVPYWIISESSRWYILLAGFAAGFFTSHFFF
jgi:hypothetical protein